MTARSLSMDASQDRELKLVNRLSESRSPYVRGHMNNPVAWQMWTPEALALAKKSNRLVFVSIGYAACHWCHVMERESFENNQVADILNNHFIPIKIDREERPDVDRIYMNYVQATTGSGGWPLNVFLTPDLEPIFGGTYWPGPTSTNARRSQVDFVDVLNKIKTIWQTQPHRCVEAAKEITAQLRQFAQEGIPGTGTDGSELELELLDEAYEHFAKKYDRKHAGFGVAPKFPTPVNLAFLLRLGQWPKPVRDIVGDEECEKAKEMAVETLRSMARGGIRDHTGNGFARYSVTRDWSLPHFEKMLYDQAQLLPVYLDAYLITKDTEMLDAVYDIAEYLLTPPMAAPNGGFFSSEDADSYYRPGDTEKREGAFYVWTRKEFQSILGDRDAEILARYFNVRENGNVSPEHDAHDEFINQNVLAIKSTPEALAKEFGLSREEVGKILKSGRAKLREHREKERPRPALDDKIVVGWNGLAIGGLARASVVLEDLNPDRATKYRAAAVQAVEFIRKELYDEPNGTLKRVFREGPGDAPAFADDYTFLISGLLDLYDATFNDTYLHFADDLQKTQLSHFWDSSPSSGGFFSTAADQPDLILRLKEGMDGAEPSTNGLAAVNLLRFAALLADDDGKENDTDGYAARARSTCAAFEAEAMQHPFLFPSLLQAVVMSKLGVRSSVVVGEESDEGVGRKLREAVARVRGLGGMKGTVVRIGGKGGPRWEWVKRRNVLLRELDERKPRVMVCEDGACREELEMER